MENSLSIADVASCLAIFVALITFFISRKDGRFKEIRDDIKEVRKDLSDFREGVRSEFKAVREEMHSEFKEVRKDIGEVAERLAFVEAETIMYNITPDPISRSEAAKKMWQRRRAKQMLKVEKK